MQAVGAQLVDQADASAFLAAQVEHHSAFGGDGVEGGVELRAALALERAKGFTGEALRVHAHERVWARVARDKRQVVGAGHAVTVGAHPNRAVRRRHGRFDFKAHATVGHRLGFAVADVGGFGVAVQVGDQFGNRGHQQAFAVAELDQFGQAHHLAVVVHDLADHGDRRQTGELHQVDPSLGVPGAFAHTTVNRAQRQDVAGANQAAWSRVRVGEHANRVGTVGRADTGRHTVGRVNRDRVRGATRVFVDLDHRRQFKSVGDLVRERSAQET